MDAPCSITTIRRHLNKLKIKHKKRIHHPRLTVKHKEKRLEYPRRYQTSWFDINEDIPVDCEKLFSRTKRNSN